MRGLEKNCTRWHIHTDRQTDKQTHGHGDSKTNSAKRAELVKTKKKKKSTRHDLFRIYGNVRKDQKMGLFCKCVEYVRSSLVVLVTLL